MVGCRPQGNVKRGAANPVLGTSLLPRRSSLLSIPSLDSFVSSRGTPVEILSDVNNYPGGQQMPRLRVRKVQRGCKKRRNPRDFHFNQGSRIIAVVLRLGISWILGIALGQLKVWRNELILFRAEYHGICYSNASLISLVPKVMVARYEIFEGNETPFTMSVFASFWGKCNC